MVKYIAYCPNHDWEGMRRNSKKEAEKDLKTHIDLYPDENHSHAKIMIEDNKKDKTSSALIKCDRTGCVFDRRGNDTIIIEKDSSIVKMRAIPDGVRLLNVKLKSKSTTNSDYIFDGNKVSSLNGLSKYIKKGEYKIIPSYRFVDTGGPHNLTIFIHW